MLTEINQQILELKEILRTKEKLQSLKDMVSDELENKRSQALVLEGMLTDEEKDVIRLEGTSFSSIFLSLIGKKEEKLEKEREEYLLAKLKYEECLRSIKRLDDELKYANSELKRYKGTKEEYDKLINEKQSLLIKEGGSSGKKISENLNAINELRLDIKELREAITAGERALSSLDKVQDSLESAKGWGTWDILGGGLLSNMAKHSAIDDANNNAHDFQRLLRNFEKELLDVNEFNDIELNLSSFASFADFFLDGFFADWFVQSKINDSIANTQNANRRLNSIVNDLRNDLNTLETDLRKREKEIKDLLES